MNITFFRRHSIILILVAVSILQLCYGLYFAFTDSATTDEVAHIADGYAVVMRQDNRLNPEHPPLLKVLSGVFVASQFPNDFFATQSWAEANQWSAGRELLYTQGNNADRLLAVGRIPTILVVIAWSVVMFFFARQFFSLRTAWVVYGLSVLYPDVLGHGHFITTDMMATLGYTTVLFVYVRQLKKKHMPLWPLILALGFAQLCKFSSVLLYVIVPLIGLMWRRVIDRQSRLSALRETVRESLIVVPLSLLIVWVCYVPVSMHMSSDLMHQLINTNLQAIDSHFFWVRDVLHALVGNPIIRPLAEYLLGVSMVVLRVSGGNNTFIFGEMNFHGIWWFFPVAWLVKTPIGVIVLYVLGCIAAVKLRTKKEVLIPAVVLLLVYWGFTLKGSLNLGTRHLLPTVPAVMLIVGYAWEQLFKKGRTYRVLLYSMTGWAVLSVVVNAAHPMAYMNEVSLFVPRHKILVDSALDWGQDLKRLAQYVRDNKIADINVDYFGGGDMKRAIPNAKQWHVEYGPTTGYLAVSATFIPFSHLYGIKEGKWSYDWLQDFQPIAIIGHSILVYHFIAQDFIDHPPISPYSFGPIR